VEQGRLYNLLYPNEPCPPVPNGGPGFGK